MTDPGSHTNFAPFEGVRILDFTRLLPGPWATSLAAEHGAKVLKIEDPARGDYSRASGPEVHGSSLYFESVNRSKRGIALDLRSEQGRQLAMELATRADILVESFRPGTMARSGLGYEELRELNPELVYCSLTGFGQRGPYSQSAGHDLNIAGMSGFLYPKDGDPSIPQLQLADFAAAATMVMAMMAGLLERRRVGQGMWLDVSMLDSLLSWGAIHHMDALSTLSGGIAGDELAVYGSNPRYSLYQCRDGRWVSVSLLEVKFWARFCELIGRPDLVDPGETDKSRLTAHGAKQEEYRQALTSAFAERDRAAWLSFLEGKDIPCFPVYAPDEVWTDPHIVASGLLGEALVTPDDASSGSIRLIGSPLKLTGASPRATHERFVRLDHDAAREFFG